MLTTNIYFEIKHGCGYIGDSKGKFQFGTNEEAVIALNDFVENPRSHNPNMSDENVAYWEKQKFEINKVTVIREIITMNDIKLIPNKH